MAKTPEGVALKDMKRSPPKDTAKSVDSYSPSPYPYGLELRLDNETLKKLGMKEMPRTGTKVCVYGIAEVVSTSERDSARGGEDRSVELQMQKLCVEDMPKNKEEKPPSRYERLTRRRS